MGWWLGCPVQRSDRSSCQHNHTGSCAQPQVPVHVFDIEATGHQDRQSPAETGEEVRSDQWAGRQKVSHKDFHRLPANVT
jgi:hypothetical protein